LLATYFLGIDGYFSGNIFSAVIVDHFRPLPLKPAWHEMHNKSVQNYFIELKASISNLYLVVYFSRVLKYKHNIIIKVVRLLQYKI